ncbi:hypothetical protein ACKUV4_018325 [Acinetobacter baumannii]
MEDVLAGVVRATEFTLQLSHGSSNNQGMAHNGIDNIPREGTWLLDGGERVLNPQQNKDLTNYLNNRQNAGLVRAMCTNQPAVSFADGSMQASIH